MKSIRTKVYTVMKVDEDYHIILNHIVDWSIISYHIVSHCTENSQHISSTNIQYDSQSTQRQFEEQYGISQEQM